MPLFTADALVLRTYKLAEADRIVVFLTRDRGKKRGVAPHARRPRSRFTGALEPLTEIRVAYFEKERRELVNLNYAETVRSPLATAGPECLAYSHYFAELIDACAADADEDERLFRLGVAVLDALATGTPPEALARYFECWLLRLQGVYPTDLALSRGATAFVEATRQLTPAGLAAIDVAPRVLRELEVKHQAVIASHLEKELKSIRVMNELRRPATAAQVSGRETRVEGLRQQ